MTSAPGGGLLLLSRRGQFEATTVNGVSYTLHFGDVETADQLLEQRPQGSVEADRPDSQPESSARYVMIVVSFDESALGPKPRSPQEPHEPSKPEGYDEWKNKLAKQQEMNKSAEDAASQDVPVPPQDISAEMIKQQESFRQYEIDLANYVEEPQFTGRPPHKIRIGVAGMDPAI